MAGRRKTRWRGRYTNKAAFIHRMAGLIDRQVENYESDAVKFRHMLPLIIHANETERMPSALISRALMYAECLIAIGRVPTPEYMWHLMAIDPSDAPPYVMDTGQVIDWQPHLSPGLLTIEEHHQQKDALGGAEAQ